MKMVGYIVNKIDNTPTSTPWYVVPIDAIMMTRMLQLLFLKNNISDKMNIVYHIFFVLYCCYFIITLFVRVDENGDLFKSMMVFRIQDVLFIGMSLGIYE